MNNFSSVRKSNPLRFGNKFQIHTEQFIEWMLSVQSINGELALMGKNKKPKQRFSSSALHCLINTKSLSRYTIDARFSFFCCELQLPTHPNSDRLKQRAALRVAITCSMPMRPSAPCTFAFIYWTAYIFRFPVCSFLPVNATRAPINHIATRWMTHALFIESQI